MNNLVRMLICLGIFHYVTGYNIETSGSTIRYLLSPEQQKIARIKTGERPPPTRSAGGESIIPTNSRMEPGPQPSDDAPSFFGYDFTVNPDKDGFSAVVGAPKTNDAADPAAQPSSPPLSATGDISSCPLGDIFTSVSPPFCPSDNPPGIQPGDAFGLSVGASPDGRKTACSPTKTQNCTAVRYNPGYCYNQHNLTSPWKADPETKNKECPAYALDLMFVLDGSGSVGEKNFQTVKNWVKEVADNFNIADGSARVGVIQYSHYYDDKDLNAQPYIVTEVGLGEFTNQSKLNHAIEKIKLSSFTTYTAHALNKSVDDFRESDRFDTASKVLILLTDGKSSDTHLLPESAKYVRSLGIKTFAVGVGKAEESELRTIATGTQTNENVYKVSDFNQLNQIVTQLKTAILTFALEGSSGATHAAYKMELAETGFSIEPSKRNNPSGGLYLGAVGAYDWSGTIVKYDSANDQEPDIPDFDQVKTVLPNWTKESYLGYALSSGFYNGGTTDEYVAIGAPRHILEGAVVVYKPKVANASFTDASTIYATPNKQIKQLGSYYGGVLLSLDINGDKEDDLLVAAPLYTETTSYDDGRVFVYTTKPGSDNPKRWASSSYTPAVLTSRSSTGGGRFGTAMASAGDINNDNYNDVIIGAPYADDNKGAVYVFHGSAEGIDPLPKQTIRAASLPNSNLKYFGLSIQGGQDLDGNGYPDVVVGAPKSDAVLIFRTRPVVKFSGSLIFDSTSIDIFKCFHEKPEKNCLSLRACLEADGKNIESEIAVTYKVHLDTLIPGRDNKRVEFRLHGNSSTSPATYSDSGSRSLAKGVMQCWDYTVYVKEKITDYATEVQATMSYQLAESHTSKPLSSVRDPSISNEFVNTTSFARNCGRDKTCLYNLGVAATTILPPATLTIGGGKAEDLTNNGKILIISSQTSTHPVTVKVNLTNTGENAFDVRVSITFNYDLSWTNLGVLQSSDPTSTKPCVVVSPQGDTSDGQINRTKLLSYASQYYGSIMQANQWCYFEFNLSSTNLKDSGSIPAMQISINAFTESTKNSNDTDPSNNIWKGETPIRYRADSKTTDRTSETTVPYNYTSGNETIRSVIEIGRNTSDIQLKYEMSGKGHSNIPHSTIKLRFPYNLPNSNSQHLFYLYKYDCSSNNDGSTCVCDNTYVNPYNLLTRYPTVNDTNLPNVTVIANPDFINETLTYDCSIGSNQSEGVCASFKCNITNLGEGDIVQFSASFRLWTQSLNLNNENKVVLRSGFEFSTADSPLIINDERKNVTIYTSATNTDVRLYKAPTQIIKENPLWIYIVAAIGGLLLLILIIIILWKTGFFKSKYAEKKEALEWTEANGAGDAASTANMMN